MSTVVYYYYYFSSNNPGSKSRKVLRTPPYMGGYGVLSPKYVHCAQTLKEVWENYRVSL